MKNKISLLISVVYIFFQLLSPVYAQSTEEYPEYIVQSGDTLSEIASIFGVTMEEIQQINNIQDPNSIYPDLRLKIPGYPGISGLITPININLNETWSNLLVKYQIDEMTLINVNKLISPSTLFAGSELLVPLDENIAAFAPVAIMSEHTSFLENSASLNANPYNLLADNQKLTSLDFHKSDLIYDDNPELPVVNSISEMIDTISISPLPPTQGDTISIKIKTKVPLILSGTFNGTDLRFYSEDNLNYFALLGIHAMAEPGITNLFISATDGSKELFSFHQNILISAGLFDSDPNLSVAPEMIDPAYTAPELEKIKNLISIYTPEKYWEGKFISPDVDYALEIPNYDEKKEITSFYGNRRTYNDDPEITFHTGIDFGGGVGLPIVASADGKVVFSDYLDVRGNATIIDHGLGVYTAYFHQSEIFVKTGDMVKKGQQIGKVGNTGRVDRANEYSGAGAHLHWEIWVNGIQVDPLEWINFDYPR